MCIPAKVAACLDFIAVLDSFCFVFAYVCESFAVCIDALLVAILLDLAGVVILACKFFSSY